MKLQVSKLSVFISHLCNYIYIYIYIYAYTHIHIHIHIHIHTYTHTHIHIYITMISLNNATQAIVTPPQIKDILATKTTTTIVKMKARTNNTWQMKTTLGAIMKTIITIKE